jgi:hypothetical protein
MRFVHYLQHWLGGTGARLQVPDFVPIMHPIRQWADTFPWAALVRAIEQSFDTRFPKKSPRGRRPVPIRVAWVTQTTGASDGSIACARTLPSCMPVASETIRSIPRKPILSYPRPSASFVAALTKPLWMSCSPSKPPQQWQRGWSVRRISSSIPSPVNRQPTGHRCHDAV